MSTRKIILVKHAESHLVPEVTAERWTLTDRGRAQCGPLADALRPHAPGLVVASTEPKAIETGQLVARRLGVPFETELGLHEHDRSNVPLVPRDHFEAEMKRFFASPRDLVYGRETAEEARHRFEAALVMVLREYPAAATGPALAVVTHGTVIALLLARPNDKDPFTLWKGLTTPSFVVVDETWRIETFVGDIA